MVLNPLLKTGPSHILEYTHGIVVFIVAIVVVIVVTVTVTVAVVAVVTRASEEAFLGDPERRGKGRVVDL